MRFARRLSWPNISKPKTFNEHILARKLDPQFFEYSVYADKYRVKDVVANKIGCQYIIPTIAVYPDAHSVAQAKIVGPAVIKPTHLSGKVILLSRDQLITERQKAEMTTWLDENLFLTSGEPQYLKIKPAIIVEEYIGTNHEFPRDYKVFCWSGSARIIQVDDGRFLHHTRSFFDKDWCCLDIEYKYPRPETPPGKPDDLRTLVRVAEQLAEGFDFVRVDLYVCNDRIYFGELTFHPESGYAPFKDKAMDLWLGEFFNK